MEYGYARISTQHQSIDRQIRNIQKEFPNAHISTEAYSGTTTVRPEFEKVLKTVKAGDTIIFDSVSRMSRNADEGIEIYFRLYDMGVNLVFLKESYINTDTYRKAVQQTISSTGNEIADIYIEATNRVIKVLAREQIKKAFEQAEKEVTDLHERTKEGLVTARLNGKQIGQRSGAKLNVKKKAPAQEIIRKHSKDFDGTLNDIECMRLTTLSRNTYYRYKRELKAEQAEA